MATLVEATKSKKKTEENRNPISKELTATKSYAHKLSKVYGKYIVLAPNAAYKGPSIKMSFFCNLCQGITVAKASSMLNGAGCRECRTSSAHIHELDSHKAELKLIYDLANVRSQFQLAADPVTFNPKSKYYYRCVKCESQVYVRPGEVSGLSCVACEHAGERFQLMSLYRQRLNSMYLMTIDRIGEFSMTHPILHMCNRHTPNFSWMSTVSEMLSGKGCPRCASPVQFKTIEPVSISGKQFVLKSKAELKVLRALKNLNYKMSEVLTRFEYPIPVTFGKHTPAFYIKSTNTIIEVMPDVEKIKERFVRIIQSRDLLRNLGFRYVLGVLVGKKAVEFRETHNILDVPKKIRQVSIPRSVPKPKRVIAPVDTTEKEKKERAKEIRREKLRTLQERKSIERRLAPHFASPEKLRKYILVLQRQAPTSPHSARELDYVLTKMREIEANGIKLIEAPPFDV